LRALFLRTLSRPPHEDEAAAFGDYLARASSTSGGRAGAARQPADRRGAGPDPLRGLERRAARAHADPRASALEDLLWALLNSSEFLFNH
jgi:hypothetical protein